MAKLDAIGLIDKNGLLIKRPGSRCYPIVEVLELAVLFDRSTLLYPWHIETFAYRATFCRYSVWLPCVSPSHARRCAWSEVIIVHDR